MSVYRIRTDRFSLKFEPFSYYDDDSEKEVEKLRVRISSYGFSADEVLNIGSAALSDFSVGLIKMLDIPEESAILEEARGYSYFSFSNCQSEYGKVMLYGKICTQNDDLQHELSFESRLYFDDIREFCEMLYADYGSK